LHKQSKPFAMSYSQFARNVGGTAARIVHCSEGEERRLFIEPPNDGFQVRRSVKTRGGELREVEKEVRGR
jgi:hypothetical protein